MFFGGFLVRCGLCLAYPVGYDCFDSCSFISVFTSSALPPLSSESFCDSLNIKCSMCLRLTHLWIRGSICSSSLQSWRSFLNNRIVNHLRCTLCSCSVDCQSVLFIVGILLDITFTRFTSVSYTFYSSYSSWIYDFDKRYS